MSPEDLAHYLHQVLGPIARMFDWSVEGRSYDLVLIRIEAKLDTTDLSTVEDRRLLIACAEMELWRWVMEQTAGFHTISTADGERRERAQIHQHASTMWHRATDIYRDATGDYAISVGRIPDEPNPYQRNRSSPSTDTWAWWDKR